MTVLYVEDDPDGGKVYKKGLESTFGCSVALATSPGQAFTQIGIEKDMGRPVPVAIVDTYLNSDQHDNEVDPLERTEVFLKRLKSENPNMRILVYSGQSDLRKRFEPLCHKFIEKGDIKQRDDNVKAAFDKVLRQSPPSPPAPPAR